MLSIAEGGAEALIFATALGARLLQRRQNRQQKIAHQANIQCTFPPILLNFTRKNAWHKK
jgi:hypothetical protein